MKKLSKYYEDVVLSPEPNAFCVLKPGFGQYKDEFERLLKLNKWKITKHCQKHFTRPEIEDFYKVHKDKPFYNKLCDYMITEPCECYSCYKRCKDPFAEMGLFKKKIRDEWGEDEMRNGMHSSDNKECMIHECGIAFNKIDEKLKVSNIDANTLEDNQCIVKLGEYMAWLVGNEDILDDYKAFDEWSIFRYEISQGFFKDSYDAFNWFQENLHDEVVLTTNKDDEYITTFEMKVNNKVCQFETRHQSEIPNQLKVN